ncbi:MAG: hypothetical protein PHT55_03475, partial [Spirochaetales bacterium]|nr:hypothetical protein [Spirochaetales bacterium]
MSVTPVFPETPAVQSCDALYEEHPDPSWARRFWFSLDGAWNLSKTGRGGKNPSLAEPIEVPFPIGSEAAGLGSKDTGNWLYSRNFSIPDKPERRWILHVGACDYRARVFVNGIALGEHRGGYSSFSIDMSKALRAGE